MCQVAGRHPDKKSVFLISVAVAFKYPFSVVFSGVMTDKKVSRSGVLDILDI
jgi:hypothetical protein